MAGDWIKIEHALPNKPEVMAMAEELETTEMEIVGHLVCFWTWVDQNLSAKCPAVSGTERGLDRVAGRTGFARAMVKVGWLRMENGMVEIPNYESHLSQSAKSRSVESKRKRRQRNKMSGTVRDKSGTEHGTREEKRREEKNTNTPKSPFSEILEKVDYPPGMNVPEVHQAIRDWLEWRRTLKKNYKQPVRTITSNLKDFSREGPLAFVEAVQHSIKREYQGIFPEGGNNGTSIEQRQLSELEQAIRESEQENGSP